MFRGREERVSDSWEVALRVQQRMRKANAMRCHALCICTGTDRLAHRVLQIAPPCNNRSYFPGGYYWGTRSPNSSYPRNIRCIHRKAANRVRRRLQPFSIDRGRCPTTLLMGGTEDARKPIRVVQHVANGCLGIEVLVSSLIGCQGGSTLALVVGLVLQ
jgi:hypothetical protein